MAPRDEQDRRTNGKRSQIGADGKSPNPPPLDAGAQNPSHQSWGRHETGILPPPVYAVVRRFSYRSPATVAIIAAPIIVSLGGVYTWVLVFRPLSATGVLFHPLTLAIVSFVAAFFFLIIFALALAADHKEYKHHLDSRVAMQMRGIQQGQARHEKQVRELLEQISKLAQSRSTGKGTAKPNTSKKIHPVSTPPSGNTGVPKSASVPKYIPPRPVTSETRVTEAAAEPSIEAILQSIRRIISDDATPEEHAHKTEPDRTVVTEFQLKRIIWDGDPDRLMRMVHTNPINTIIDEVKRWTPLHYAAYLSDVGTIKTLLEHGADPTQRDVNELCASDIAERCHREVEICDLLMDAFVGEMSKQTPTRSGGSPVNM